MQYLVLYIYLNKLCECLPVSHYIGAINIFWELESLETHYHCYHDMVFLCKNVCYNNIKMCSIYVCDLYICSGRHLYFATKSVLRQEIYMTNLIYDYIFKSTIKTVCDCSWCLCLVCCFYFKPCQTKVEILFNRIL